MAQEFHALFGQDDFGTIGNDTLVNAIDMMGIAMSAIKGAKLRTDALQKENETIKKVLLELQNIIDIQRSDIQDLKEKINDIHVKSLPGHNLPNLDGAESHAKIQIVRQDVLTKKVLEK